MLSLIPSIHATILSIAVAVVAVVAPIAYQKILKERHKLSENIRMIREVFSGALSGGGDFEEYFTSDNDEEFVEHFRTTIKNIVNHLRSERGVGFIQMFDREFMLLRCFSSRFMDRSPFIGYDDGLDDFISSDIIRYHKIRSFFDDTYWMLINRRAVFDEMINRYYDVELPRLKGDCLRMAEGKMQTPNLDGAEVYLNNASLWRGTSVDEINRQKAEFIFTSIVGLTVNKKELLSFLDELTAKFEYTLSRILPVLIENKIEYDKVNVLFKAKDELLKFYRFVYSTITFGIFIPLVLNEFYNFFNLDGFCFFKIISLAFVLTFIPYYIALKKLYSVINLIKL
ncbi:hypothetical protein AAHW07_06030 [Klebsiella variicola subsp. variicola]|uniref:hypothetical protein n=1 Tax=Klebsiella variicola TaxID=244366 RepID=UPI0035B67ABE